MKRVVVSRADREAMSKGTRLAVVRSIMMTSTAKTMAASGALNIAAKEAVAAHPISTSR